VNTTRGQKSGAVATAVGLLLTVGLASSPASAAEMPITLPASTTYGDALQVLEDEAGRQSPAEIAATDALASERVHVELYEDEFGRILSAVAVPKTPRSRAVWWESPGCSASGACVTAGGRSFGYNGIGTLNGSWSSVTRVAAGNADTGLWSGRTGKVTLKNRATTYRVPIAGNRLIRSS
jgi:hypothetical protein